MDFPPVLLPSPEENLQSLVTSALDRRYSNYIKRDPFRGKREVEPVPFTVRHRFRSKSPQVLAELKRIGDFRSALRWPTKTGIPLEQRPQPLSGLAASLGSKFLHQIQPLAEQYRGLELQIVGDELKPCRPRQTGQPNLFSHRPRINREGVAQFSITQ